MINQERLQHSVKGEFISMNLYRVQDLSQRAMSLHGDLP